MKLLGQTAREYFLASSPSTLQGVDAPREANLKRARRTGSRFSNAVVLVLMIVTSGVSLYDLYLLTSAFPH